jgi:hypothetical protein
MNQHGMTTSTSIRLALAACLALPAACSRHEPPAPPRHVAATPAPPRALDGKRSPEIMRAIFGNDYDAAADRAIGAGTNDGAVTRMAMTLLAAATLPDGRIGAIVNGAPADDNGNDVSLHANAGTLHVYVLRRAGPGWTLAERHENIAELGSFGHMTSARWVALGPGKTGFLVSSGGVWQGQAIGEVDIFELGKGVRSLGKFNEMSSTAEACTPAFGACWDIHGGTRLTDDVQPNGYRDIVVDFTGKRYTLGAGVERVSARVNETARYRFDGKAYVLAAGANPAPDI